MYVILQSRTKKFHKLTSETPGCITSEMYDRLCNCKELFVVVLKQDRMCNQSAELKPRIHKHRVRPRMHTCIHTQAPTPSFTHALLHNHWRLLRGCYEWPWLSRHERPRESSSTEGVLDTVISAQRGNRCGPLCPVMQHSEPDTVITAGNGSSWPEQVDRVDLSSVEPTPWPGSSGPTIAPVSWMTAHRCWLITP